MAKVHLDRLKQRYGWTGGKYRRLMDMIMTEQTQSIQNAIGRLSAAHFNDARDKLPTNQKKRFVVPDVSDVLPKRSLFIRKGAEKGELLSDNLRDNLTRQLRNTFSEFSKTGEQAFLTRRGTKAGRINQKLVEQFERRITDTFKGYTKKDPRYGVPENVHAIAVTEVRSAADEIKYNYTQRLLERNPEAEAFKVWIHNKSLSKTPREHHMALDGVQVPFDEKFVVDNPKFGRRYLAYPHDPEAPAEEVINCYCDFDIMLRVPGKRSTQRRIERSVHKGKPAEIGETREWADGTYKKVSEDRWEKVESEEGDKSSEALFGQTNDQTSYRAGQAADKWREETNLSEEDEKNRIEYTNTMAVPTNAQLRSGEVSPENQEIVDSMDRAIEQAPGLEEPLALFRGAAMNDEELAQLEPGATMSDAGFLSTTGDREMAEVFADTNKTGGRKPVVFEIEAPEGSKAAAGNRAESELVFGRNTNMEIASKFTDGDGNTVVRGKIVNE